MAGSTTFLVEQGYHYVNRFDQLVVKARRQALGIRKRQLELAGQFVHSHISSPKIFWVAQEQPEYPRFEGNIPGINVAD